MDSYRLRRSLLCNLKFARISQCRYYQARIHGRLYRTKKKDERYFLGVTPNIYRLTGFQRFKSIRQKLAVNGALNMPEGYTALVSLPTVEERV